MTVGAGTIRPGWAIFVTLLALSFSGAWISASLTLGHLAGKDASRLLSRSCGEDNRGCDRVLSSRWSVFPPGRAGQDTSDFAAASVGNGLSERGAGGFPVAALGMFYFSLLFIVIAVSGGPGERRSFNRVSLILIPLVALSCAGSVGFLFLMKFAIGAWCPLCLTTHAINFTILGMLWWSRLRGDRFSLKKGIREAAGSVREWDFRMAGTTVALVITAFFGEWYWLRSRSLSEINSSLQRELSDAGVMEMAYIELKSHPIEIRPDDPMIESASGTRMTLVVFSDVPCPFCAAFDHYLREEVLPLFRGHLRVVYKHYPMKEHRHALEAATALEAARMQGRFIEAHDSLVESRRELAQLDYNRFARDLGLDRERFFEDMRAPSTMTRILEDKEILEKIMNPTVRIPAVFLNQRLLTSRMRSVSGFWERRANALKRTRTASGQPWGGSEFDPMTDLRSAPKPRSDSGLSPWTLSPRTANFGYLSSSEDIRRIVIQITGTDDSEVPEFETISSSGNRFRAYPLPGDASRIVVETIPPFRRGAVRETISLRSGERNVKLMAFTDGPAPVSYSPRKILWPLPDGSGQQTIRLTSVFAEKFRIENVTAELTGLELQWARGEWTSDSVDILVSFSDEFEMAAGSPPGFIDIDLSHREIPRIRLPIIPVSRTAPPSPRAEALQN